MIFSHRFGRKIMKTDAQAQAQASNKSGHTLRPKTPQMDLDLSEAGAGDRFSELGRRDAEIALSARNVVRSAKYLPNQDTVNVAVKNGWVTLWGEADWDYKRQPAARAVFRLAGVTGISDQIAVNPRETLGFQS
jgi:osmotically-inducible protein OsmY